MTDYTVETTSQENVAKQQNRFHNLIVKLGEADLEEIKKVLSKREIVQPEAELTPETILYGD